VRSKSRGDVNPSSFIRKAAKAAVLPFGVAARRRADDLAILLYHRVGVEAREIGLPVAIFEAHLSYLADRHNVVTLDDAVPEGSDGGIVVTFDDGARDFHEHALPLLVSYGIPSVLYLTTGYPEGDRVFTLPDGEGLSWAQLQEAVATGLVTVGSHTHSHISLLEASESEAEDEMRRSKELIEDRLGVACRHFAYPFAMASAGADRAARRLFDTAATDAWRTNRRGRTDPHRLGRTPILRSDGKAFFRAKVAGMLDREALLYRALGRGPWRRP
jgi:peptidoglycan/xylan/chitin deacetylase (PgdA/CDA1 family)